jgi:hypothetical protein
MLDRQTQLKLTDLIQDQFSDLDIYREKPFIYDNKQGLLLIVKPVTFKEHDIFLKQMSALIVNHYDIFSKIDFLNHQDFKDKNTVDALVAKVSIFEANQNYTKFKRQATEFVLRWAYVTKKKPYITLQHNRSLCRKIVNTLEPDQFIHIVFLLFVYNFDIVKKNLVEFMKIFKHDIIIESSIATGTLSHGISQRVVVMPKYSKEPFSKSDLDLLEQQSKIELE